MSDKNAAPGRVGWVGLGNMGSAMATNIQNYLRNHNLESLRIFNRTASKCVPIERVGATTCQSITELAVASDIIFISTADDAASTMVVNAILEAGDAKGKMIIDTTTVHPDTAKKIAATVTGRGGLFAAMPVFGAAPVAQAGKLLAALAGPQEVRQAISPLIEGVIAREVLFVGDEPEKALLLKTTGNIMMASLMQIIAEAHVFAEKAGLPSETLERLLELNFGTVMHSDSIRMTTGVYCPGVGQSPWSDLDLGIKDVGHGIQIADRSGVDLAVGNLTLRNMKAAREWSVKDAGDCPEDRRRLDSSGLFGIVREQSGLAFTTEVVKKRDAEQ